VLISRIAYELRYHSLIAYNAKRVKSVNSLVLLVSRATILLLRIVLNASCVNSLGLITILLAFDDCVSVT